MRILWSIAGGFSLIVGMIGVVVPLLPTAPFVILAAYCFALSSPRLHDWLLAHRHFGPLIVDWRENRAIRRPAKIMATISIALVFAISLLLGVGLHLLAVQGVVLAGVLLFIWFRPDGAPAHPR